MNLVNQDKLNDIIGRNIKYYRIRCKKYGFFLTQERLAEMINVSVSLISGLESKKVKKGISISNLYKIAFVLDVPIKNFLEDKDEC